LLGAFTSSIKTPGEGTIPSTTGPVELFTWPAWGPKVLLGLGVLGAVMTAFYMVRLYVMTFMGDFKGWKVVSGYAPPAHEEHGAHGHDHHETPGTHLEGPTPHESPWQMTFPLMVLGVLALVGGLWNAHPMTHFMDEWLEPVFESALKAVSIAEDANAGIVMALAIGAFGIGSLAAWHVYARLGGAPAADFAEKYPRFYAWACDKWRVDEFYDEFVIGTVDFIADICVWIDRWVVDGIVARFTSWLVAVAGHLLRLLQTGRVQAYASVMMVGTAAMGWFLTMPHAAVVVDGDRATGRYSLSAAPGLGYAYRWDLDGDGNFDSEEFGSVNAVDVTLSTAEERTVRLEVKNAFGRVAMREVALSQATPETPPAAALGVSDTVRVARAQPRKAEVVE
jgi:NADH-quinone oxidoreductase subunit L